MNIWLLEIEAHEQRYTRQWRDHLPTQLERAARDRDAKDVAVQVVSGEVANQVTTPGAFLNFAGTNVFKCGQIIRVAQAFERGEVKPGDRFLVTDAWHPGIIQIRYMSDLLKVPVEIHALWHAGSYDPWDFLGREVRDKRWSQAFERAVFHASDANYFATDFHIDLFKTALAVNDDRRIVRTGWPMEYLSDVLLPFASAPKSNVVLFPHRLAPEKQVEIFRDLAWEFPDYEFVVCQENPLNKEEYHHLLGRSVLVFSASLQETLGIGLYEGMLSGALPLAPNRLSYSEMYPAEFLYPSAWTEDYGAYQANKPQLVQRVREMLGAAKMGSLTSALGTAIAHLEFAFFSGDTLYDRLFQKGVRCA